MVLGCIFQNPSLIHNPAFPIAKTDFEPIIMHKILFICADYLSKSGVTDIGFMEIDNFISSYQAQKEILDDSNFVEFVDTVRELAVLENYEYYYTSVRKYSLLRDLRKKGLSISEYYDETKEETEAQKQLEKWSITDILNQIDSTATSFRNKYDTNFTRSEMFAGENTEELIEEFEQVPAFGSFLTSPYLTQLYMGLCRGHLIMNSAPSGVGKALTNNTILPTPNGDRRVKDIKVGDCLFDKNGNPTKVIGVFPQGQKQVYEVKFRDGRIVECCEEHLWTVRPDSKRHYNGLVTITAKEMIAKTKQHKYYYKTPTNKPVNYTTKKYFIPPYSFGLFLGDGSFRSNPSNRSFQYSSQDEELLKYISEETGWEYKKNSANNYTWSFYKDNNLVHVEEMLKEFPELIDLYSQEKYIPEIYLHGNIQQRFDLLNGLLDSDGGCVKGRITYYSTSPKLIANVKTLCYSLGLHCSETLDKRCARYKSGYGCTLHIMVPVEYKNKMFRLTRKRKIYQEYNLSHTKQYPYNYLGIESINATNRWCDMTCFLVDNPEHLFLANDYVVTHNTRMMIADLCNISVDTLWSDEHEDFIPNLNYDGPGLYIHSELASRKEINPMFLACVSGVDVKHITMGNLDNSEKIRVLEAGRILERNNLILCDMPDFTSANIKRKIEDCVRQYGTTTIGFDYLQLQSAISAEYKATTSIPAREDLVLRALATDLKSYAEQYNVAIMTASQLNGTEKTMEFPDESCLSSSKAIKTKLDAGCITLSIKDRPKEYKIIEPYLKRKGFDRDKDPMPNVISYVLKARFGEYADQKLKVFRYFDRGTLKNKDFFVVDQYNQLVNIPKPVLESEF